MAVSGIVVMYRGVLRPWMYTWGGDDRRTGAGDMALVGPDRRRPRRFLQLRISGTGRARIRNSDTIHAEWQDLHVGDTIWLARRYGADARQAVALIEPEADLVLMSPADFERVLQGDKASAAWSFHLRHTNTRTRRIGRRSGGLVGHPWFDIAHFIMEHGMMCGVRERAERVAHAEYEYHGGVNSVQPYEMVPSRRFRSRKFGLHSVHQQGHRAGDDRSQCVAMTDVHDVNGEEHQPAR
jgi:hypothetical protein